MTSKTSGSNTNYALSASVTDTQTSAYPSFFPQPSFSTSAANMTGGRNAGSGPGVIYSYQVPSGGYAPNGNILQHVDSVMGTWKFTYDQVDRLVTSHNTATTGTSGRVARVPAMPTRHSRGCPGVRIFGPGTAQSSA